MKIKFSKDYSWMQSAFESDRRRLRRYESVTVFPDYSGTWEEADVTLEQLKEYAERGYAIRINC